MQLTTTPKNRSPNAVPGTSDLRTEFVYSSLVLTHGANAQGQMFGATLGQTIASVGSYTPTALHHLKHDLHSTNLSENGRLGSVIGDVTVRAVGLDIEQAVPQLVEATKGTMSDYGASIQEMTEIMAKTYFIVKVGSKEYVKAPTRCFPAIGGVGGSVGNTTNNSLVGAVQNGSMIRAGRALRSPFNIDRTDTLAGILGVASGATLAFRGGAAVTGATMVTCFLDCSVQADVR